MFVTDSEVARECDNEGKIGRKKHVEIFFFFKGAKEFSLVALLDA